MSGTSVMQFDAVKAAFQMYIAGI